MATTKTQKYKWWMPFAKNICRWLRIVIIDTAYNSICNQGYFSPMVMDVLLDCCILVTLKVKIFTSWCTKCDFNEDVNGKKFFGAYKAFWWTKENPNYEGYLIFWLIAFNPKLQCNSVYRLHEMVRRKWDENFKAPINEYLLSIASYQERIPFISFYTGILYH